jgi:hypothetical protein
MVETFFLYLVMKRVPTCPVSLHEIIAPKDKGAMEGAEPDLVAWR